METHDSATLPHDDIKVDPVINEDGTLMTLAVSEATREITLNKAVIVGNQLSISSSVARHTMVVEWPQKLIERAMFFNILPLIEQIGAVNIVSAAFDSLTTHESAEPTSVVAIEDWAGYADAIANITYTVKAKGGKPGAPRSRIERVKSLMSDINATRLDIVSAESRLRTLKNTSPQPHGESGEMTLGSSAEITAQQERIQELTASVTKKQEDIAKHLELINAALAAPTDTGWVIRLASEVETITRSNTEEFTQEQAEANGIS